MVAVTGHATAGTGIDALRKRQLLSMSVLVAVLRGSGRLWVFAGCVPIILGMNQRKPRNWTTDALVALVALVVNVILGAIVGDNVLSGRATLNSSQGITLFVWTLTTVFLCLLAFRSWSQSLYPQEG
jgi:hypothetical protein